MRVFYSIYKQLEQLSQYGIVGTDPCTGWGKLIDGSYEVLKDYGIEFVDNIKDADIELFIGQPSLKVSPSMSPNIVLTMYESSKLPTKWVQSLNLWDIVINPSTWGCNVFRDSGVTTHIFYVPLWVDDRFKFQYREDLDPWTVLLVCVQLTDRKNAQLVADLFMEECGNRLPSDIRLIIKAIPNTNNPIVWSTWFSPNVYFLQKDLTIEQFNKLYKQCHVSLNPSSGEGFGWLPLEGMLTGCCTILSDFSALSDHCNKNYNLAIPSSCVPSKYSGLLGNIGYPDSETIIEHLNWTYNNRADALKMGKASSKWIQEKYSSDKFCSNLEAIMLDLIKGTPKRGLPVLDKNYIPEDLTIKNKKG